MSAKERIHPILDRDSDDFTVHLNRYRLALPYVQGKKILDLGCGMGYGSYYMRNLGAREVTGVDIDSGSIEFARSHYVLPGLYYLETDFIKLAVKIYDVVIAFEFIEHVIDPLSYIRQTVKCLSDDGILLLSTPYINNPYIKKLDQENPYHLSTRSKEELEKMLREAGFKDIRAVYQQKSLADPRSEELREQLMIIQSNLFWYRLSNLIRKVIHGHRGNEDISRQRTSGVYRWNFSLFPSETTEVVVFICGKRIIQSINVGNLHIA